MTSTNSTNSTSGTARSVLAGLDSLRSGLEDLYRDLHRHPEPGLREHRTAKKAADALRESGYDVTEGVGGTGVIGVLVNGDGPVVMVRADMDALPVRERTGLPYASAETVTVRSVKREGGSWEGNGRGAAKLPGARLL